MAKQELPPNDSSSSRHVVYIIGLLLAAGVTFTLLRMLLPVLRIMLPIVVGWWFWRRWQTLQQSRQTALDATFYQFLEAHQGQVTVLDFAMTAGLSAHAAKDYLEARARDFSAQYEVTDRGDVYYLFPTLKSPQFRAMTQSTTYPDNDRCTTVAVAEPMTQAQLARRLQVSAGVISRKKLSSDLAEWSKSRDPDGVAWAYQSETRRFLPLNSQVH